MGAFVGAFLGRKLAHYPRFPDADGNWRQVTDSEMVARVSSGLSQLSHDDSRLHDAVKAGRETLDEVKSLTEYQDQKATRLLTIITFLSALSSILFARFVASHPLHANFAQSSVGDYSLLLVVVTYSLFGIFAFLAISGALIVFHATPPSFVTLTIRLACESGPVRSCSTSR